MRMEQVAHFARSALSCFTTGDAGRDTGSCEKFYSDGLRRSLLRLLTFNQLDHCVTSSVQRERNAKPCRERNLSTKKIKLAALLFQRTQTRRRTQRKRDEEVILIAIGKLRKFCEAFVICYVNAMFSVA